MKKLILMGILVFLPIWGANIAFVDPQKIFNSHPGTEKAKKELGKIVETEKQNIKIMENEIILLREELKKPLQEEAKRKKTSIIQVKMEELQKYQENAVSKIDEKKSLLEENIKLDITKIIEKLAKEKKIDFVLDKALMIYGKPGFDITPLVIKSLGATPKK